MLVLGDKYDVAEFRAEGIRQLELAFPPNISDWHKARTGELPGARGFSATDLIPMANVVRTLNRPDLLAAVLYHCCLLDISDILCGVTGTRRRPGLHPDDLLSCLKAREQLPNEWLLTPRSVLGAHPPEGSPCLTPASCRTNSKKAAYSFAFTSMAVAPPALMYDVLAARSWRRLCNLAASSYNICAFCTEFYHGRCKSAQQELRDSLIRRFGLQTA